MVESLSVSELIKKSYDILGEKNSHEEISFAPVNCEIADDSDGHRNRTGYMKYERANVFSLNGKLWAVSTGKKTGQYPWDEYENDLSIVILQGDKTEESVKKAMGSNYYFRNSMIIGRRDGRILTNKESPFGRQMFQILGKNLEDYIAENPAYNEETLDMNTFGPVCTSSMKYKPEFAEFLADVYVNLLKLN